MSKSKQVGLYYFKSRNKINGFSLVEIMFSVLVLTLGLIFVAIQFPVGIANSQRMKDATLNIINSNNASIQTELQFKALPAPTSFVVDYINTGALLIEDGNVHMLIKPNVVNNPPNNTNNRDPIVLDDPEDNLLLGPLLSQDYNIISALGFAPFITTLPALPTDLLSGGSLGNIVSPPVSASDSDVLELAKLQAIQDRGLTINELIFAVAKNRKENWCALYLSNTSTVNKYRYYYFSLKNTNKGLRYIGQQFSAATGDPTPDTAINHLRHFPVPWRIDLNFYDTVGNTERNYIGTGTQTVPEFTAPDTFELTTAGFYDKIIVEDSILIDADFNLGLGWVNNGYVYKVKEVVRKETSGVAKVFVKLDSPLRDNLNFIWIFPPAYDIAQGVFSTQQPVINVVEKTVQY